MRPTTRIAPIALALFCLSACERAPETPPPAPKTEEASLPPAPPPPVEVSVPMPTPEVVVAPDPAPVHKPGVKRPVEAPLPAGFVRITAGTVTGPDGRPYQTGAYAIAREPVTVAQLREWAEAGGGRRLPQLLGAADAAVASDLDWLAADAYARWLSAREQRRYRLPSEIEWRRAAQGGRIATQAQRQPAEPPLWEWTADCWDEEAGNGACASRVLVGGDNTGDGDWGRAPMGARRPAASFRLVLELP